MSFEFSEPPLTKKVIFRKRLALIGIFASVFIVSFVIGKMITTPTEAQAQLFLEMIKQQIKGIDGIGIFTHNTLLSLPMFIPFFGMVWGSLIALQTGGAVANLLVLEPNALQGLPVVTIFASPFGIMELMAYSIAMSRSFILSKTVVKNGLGSLKKYWKVTVIDTVILIGLLLVGGIVEFEIIKYATEMGLVQEGLLG